MKKTIILAILSLFCYSDIECVGVDLSPAPIPQVEVVPDAKIVEVDGKWAIVLSNKTVYFIRQEDADRFLKWMQDSPAYTVERGSPYQLVDLATGESFDLEEPEEDVAELWVLGFGNEHFYTLNSTDGDTLILVSDDETQDITNWKFVRSHEIKGWEEGNTTVVIDVLARSQHSLWRTVGYLLFRFTSKEDALQWINFLKTNEGPLENDSPEGFFILPLDI